MLLIYHQNWKTHDRDRLSFLRLEHYPSSFSFLMLHCTQMYICLHMVLVESMEEEKCSFLTLNGSISYQNTIDTAFSCVIWYILIYMIYSLLISSSNVTPHLHCLWVGKWASFWVTWLEPVPNQLHFFLSARQRLKRQEKILSATDSSREIPEYSRQH